MHSQLFFLDTLKRLKSKSFNRGVRKALGKVYLLINLLEGKKVVCQRRG